LLATQKSPSGLTEGHCLILLLILTLPVSEPQIAVCIRNCQQDHNVAADAYHSVCIVLRGSSYELEQHVEANGYYSVVTWIQIGSSYEQEQKIVYVANMGSREMDTFLGRKSEVKKPLGRTRHRWGTSKLILKRGYEHDSAGLRKRQG
jgi:hypothetical protein